MQLALPARAAAIEGQALKIQPGAVFLFQPGPFGIALVGREAWVFVHNVLKFVHHRAVGQEVQGVFCVCKLIARRLVPKEQVVEICREELHAHGMDFAALHAGLAQDGGDVFALGHIIGKGMAGLVRQHIHIARRAVEIGKDERQLVIRQAGAVAAGRLARFCQHVEQLVFKHLVNKGAGLGA